MRRCTAGNPGMLDRDAVRTKRGVRSGALCLPFIHPRAPNLIGVVSKNTNELKTRLGCNKQLPWCTTPIEADSSLGPDSHHPVISLSGIPSAVMVFRILHPILASTLCAANPLARIAEPTIAL